MAGLDQHLTNALANALTGTRWLSRWDKELDLIVKLLYYGLTTGRGNHAPKSCGTMLKANSVTDPRRRIHRYLAKLIK